MDPLHSLERDTLLRFFHVNKSEMSVMENPHVFIRQLRDHDLIPEDRYENLSRMRSKENLKRGLYEALDWLERKRAHRVESFWKCVFTDTMMHHYPALKLLRNRLMDGSYVADIETAEVEKEESGRRKKQDLSEDEDDEERKDRSVKKKIKQRRKNVLDDDDDEERKDRSVKKKIKQRRKNVLDDDDEEEEEEQPGTSSQSTPSQRKKSTKICYSSPLKAGEKNDIWNWTFFKTQLPVNCGEQEGMLIRDKLARGEKCISVGKQWFTPSEFEKFAGKQSSRNWKLSIHCKGTPLGKLIQEGHLKAARYKRVFCKAKKTLFPSDDEDDTTDEEEEEAEEQADTNQKKVFKVTCGASTGTLHKKRFASGVCGKSIRTQTSWMTPVEFVKEASDDRDPSWRKHIKCEGEPLSALIKAKILGIHSPLCDCKLCRPDSEDLEDERNDDECCVCKSDEKEEEELVMCDRCPHSFHLTCHLPHVQEAVLGDGNHWMCTFCEFTSNREYYQDELERDVAMSSQISQHMLQCQYLILRLCSADEEQTIARDPNLDESDYSSVIDTPMWLGKVAEKLEERLYGTVGDFVSDVQLIFTNFASYNQENADSLALGNRLQKLFDKEFNNVFNIHEEIVGQ